MAPPPDYDPVQVSGEFNLVDAKSGTPVSRASFDGQWRLVFFGFTNCAVICPTGLLVMGGILEEMGDQADRLKPLFITVDPSRDSAEVVAKYMKNFDPRISALVGSEEDIKKAMKAFRMEAHKMEVKSDQVYQIDHPALMMLMDAGGKYIKSLPSAGDTKELAQQVLEAIKGE